MLVVTLGDVLLDVIVRLGEPLVASRSERAILTDVESALAEAAGVPRRPRGSAGAEGLF